MKTVLGIALALSLSAAGYAADFHYEFPIDGAQEVPPVPTLATGWGIVDYNDVTNLLQWDISYSGLVGDLTNGHFHGPAAPGVNAGVQVPLVLTPSPMVGSAFITELQEAELLSGLWYVNIHTTFRPSGEIRGQVVPEPASLALLSVALLLRRR